MVEMTSGPPTRQVLATRGERFALARALWRGAGGDIGPSEVEWLLIIEVDDRGDHRVVVSCKPDDLDAAYAELDARWWAGEERAHPRVAAYQTAFERRLASRDWDALATLFAPTLVARDHRLVGWDTLRGPAAFVGAFRALVDLAPDVRVRVDHMRMSERGIIGDVAWVGTRDGGAFESPFINVVELDADGKAARLDLYDPHHLDAALARFDEIRTSAVRDPLAAIARPNAAAATMERWQATFDAALESDDWEVVRGLCAAGMIFEDRQRMALVSGNAELMIASARERARAGARPEARLVGTAGDRVVIVRMLWSGGPPGGRFEIEYFSVIEVDEAGRLTAVIFFDLDDPRAAVREAWARWATIDPAAAPWVDLVGAIRDSYNANDWERLRALFADDIVIEDHRRTGFGRMEGVDVYLESVKVLWGLVSDQRVEMGWFWPAVERHGVVIAAGRFGTLKDGGAFESEFLSLWVVAGGRITWFEMFEVEDLDKALARLAELRPDPLRIPPNAATRAYDRWYERAKAGDWEAIQALFDERFRFEDRRRVMRLTGDRDMGIASDRYTWESGGRPTRTLLSTAGDRMVLQRMLWTLSEGGRVSEVELIELNEVDADGRFITALLFDPDDRAAASAELFDRYAASGAEGLPPETIELARAFNAHDLERMRALLPAEFYLDDRRRTGVGRMEGADAYLRSLAALWELSDDLRSEALYTVTSAEHGRLMVARWFGTNAEGGDFEAVFVTIGLLRGGRPVGVEIFELDDLEAARARFEELGSRQR
jgi:ketosteroid isomerase-like protein